MIVGPSSPGPYVPRNKDGLVIPSTKLFGILVAIYKIILIITWIFIVLAIIGLVLFYVVINSLDEKQMRDLEARDPKARENIALMKRLMPTLVMAIVVTTIHNIIAWIGIKTFRMRYLNIDFWLQCFFLGLWFVNMFMVHAYADGFATLFAQVAQTAIVFFIIREIRNANAF